MDQVELIYSFSIGIASGIVSSVLVTAFYRKRDEEKERQAYFASLRMYVDKLLITKFDDITAMIDFYCSNELPPVFRWVPLKNDEYKTIAEISMKVLHLQELISQYSEEKLNMSQKGFEPKDTDFTLNQKYLPQISHAHAEIIAANIELKTLGNKTLKQIRKQH